MRVLRLLWFIGMITGVMTALTGTNLPYVGLYNANNNYLALASKNFLRFGYTALGYVPTYFVGPTLPLSPPYYVHHPVLFFLFSSLAYAALGNGHWVVHVVPFLFGVA